MKLPIVATKTHLGKSLELDCERETLTVFGPSGEELGTLPWESVINQLLAQAAPKESREIRRQPRVSLSFQVRYTTPEGNKYESLASGIGGGGLFIESTDPLPVETKISMEFALPHQASEWLMAKGVVAWVCPKADQYTFSQGMGIRFTDVSSETRERIADLVRTQRRGGQPPASS